MRRYRLVVLGLLVVAIAAAAYSYFSPRMTLDSIRLAAKEKDIDRLRELVDFDSVKTNLKDDLKARVITSAKKEMQSNPFAGLGILLVNAMIDPMVDAIVSPAGLSAMVGDGRVERPSSESSKSSDAKDAPSIEQGYVSYSLYRIKISPQESPADGITVTLKREGFATWRLSRVALPETIVSAIDPMSPAVAEADGYAIRAKVSEVILAMMACRNTVNERYLAGGTPPAANGWGCEAAAHGTKYVRSITTDADGVISATVQAINPGVDGSVVTLIPLAGPGTKAAASKNLGKQLYGWTCGGTGTTLGKNHLPESCRGS